MNVRFLVPAGEEVDHAVAWYDKQGKGISRVFLDDLDLSVWLAKTYPLSGTEIQPDIRRLLFVRCPYSLIYGLEGETIVIVAVAHQQREPFYWIDRVPAP